MGVALLALASPGSLPSGSTAGCASLEQGGLSLAGWAGIWGMVLKCVWRDAVGLGSQVCAPEIIAGQVLEKESTEVGSTELGNEEKSRGSTGEKAWPKGKEICVRYPSPQGVTLQLDPCEPSTLRFPDWN